MIVNLPRRKQIEIAREHLSPEPLSQKGNSWAPPGGLMGAIHAQQLFTSRQRG